MPAAFEILWQVRGSLGAPNIRAILTRGGEAFRVALRRYPPGWMVWKYGWVRTRRLAESGFYEIRGKEAHLQALYYALYLIHGTGLRGPKHQWITPKRRLWMAWRDPVDGAWIFAKKTEGTVWPGYGTNLEESIIQAMRQRWEPDQILVRYPIASLFAGQDVLSKIAGGE